jgi:two-component system cell cycle response regulator DivK
MTERFFNDYKSTTEERKEVEDTLDWSSKTILIAEDEEVNFVYLQTALIKTMVNIIRAHNGQEAVELARVNPNIDLVLMDIKMPKMNGIEATRAIKSFRNDLIIVAQTAFAMEEDRQNCFSVGVDDFIAKPVRYKLLFDTLAKYLK